MNKMVLKDDTHQLGLRMHVCGMCEPEVLFINYPGKVTFMYELPDEAREAGWNLLAGGTSKETAWACPECMAFMKSVP